jgi:hypothetical protein
MLLPPGARTTIGGERGRALGSIRRASVSNKRLLVVSLIGIEPRQVAGEFSRSREYDSSLALDWRPARMARAYTHLIPANSNLDAETAKNMKKMERLKLQADMNAARPVVPAKPPQLLPPKKFKKRSPVILRPKTEAAPIVQPRALPKPEPEAERVQQPTPPPTALVPTTPAQLIPAEPIAAQADAVQSAPVQAAPVQAIPIQASAQVPRAKFDFLHALTLTVALVLAGVAAYFSVTGMARIFPGANEAIIAMAAVMEGGKLTGAAWLSRNWRAMGWFLRSTLTLLVIILAMINAVGVFGQLSAAHLGPHITAIAANEEEAAASNAKIDAETVLIADLSRRIAQIDTAIEEATKRGRTVSAMDLSRDQRKYRDTLVTERSAAETGLVEMKATQARIVGEQQKASADIGVLEYAAALLGVDRERMMQILILAMVLSCDPLSITLVIATASRRQSKPRG